MERSFDRVWDEFRDLRREIGDVRGEIGDMRGEVATSSRQLAQIGWALVGILLVQLIAAVVAFH